MSEDLHRCAFAADLGTAGLGAGATFRCPWPARMTGDDALALCRRLVSGRRPEAELFSTSGGGPWTESLHKRPFHAAVPAKAVADHCGTSLRMIETNYAKFIPEDRARYAAIGAPAICLRRSGQVVTPLRVSSNDGR